MVMGSTQSPGPNTEVISKVPSVVMLVNPRGNVVAARTEDGLSVIELSTSGVAVGEILWGDLEQVGPISLKDRSGRQLSGRVLLVGATHSDAREAVRTYEMRAGARCGEDAGG